MNNFAYNPDYVTNFVVNNPLNRQYAIVYEGNCFGENPSNCIIPVKSRREVELLLLSLGEEASVVMDEQARKLCNVWDWLYGRTYSDVFNELKWSCREEDEVLQIIEKIRLPKTLQESPLKLHREAPEPYRIEQEYVHKKNKENVLVSQPYRYGNMFYFNGFNKSSEFNIDHCSDHLEGIVIFETARQGGIAALHLAGVPLNGTIVLLKTTIQYKKFVELADPYLVHTIPVLRQKGGFLYVVFNIIQNNSSCATGYLTGLLYKNKETYQKHRIIKDVTEGSNEKIIML